MVTNDERSADGDSRGADPRVRLWVALGVGAACVAALLLKLWVNADRTMPGYGDISYYATLAQNLAAGRGFVIDYIPDFLSHPKGIPHPANTYWMPLASMIGAIGVFLSDGGYVAAQVSMIVFTSLAPLAVYLLGREFFASRRTALIGAWLAAPFHLFLVSGSVPLTHGPSLIVGTFAFWAIHRMRANARFAYAAGALVALAHMNRSDGILLFGVALVVLRFGGQERFGWRHTVGRMLRLSAAYAVVMAPLAWINMRAYGAPLPTGLGRLVFLRSYSGLYSLPESVNFASFWDTGLATIAAQRARALLACCEGLLFDLGRGHGRAGDDPLRFVGVVALVPLAWAGLIATRKREYLGVVCWALLGLLLYAMLFAETGTPSFHAALFAVFPLLLLSAGWTLDWLAGRLSGGRSSLRNGLMLLAIAALGFSNVSLARADLASGVEWLRTQTAFHRVLREQVFEPRGLTDERIFALQVHQLHANTGMHWVTLPFEPEPVIREVAERLDVTHVLLVGRPTPSEAYPALYEITQSEHYELVFAGGLPGGRVGLYRILRD